MTFNIEIVLKLYDFRLIKLKLYWNNVVKRLVQNC